MIGLKRDIIDKFYTKSNIAEECMNNLKEIIEIEDSDLIIEPAAGSGAFINPIKSLTNNYIFYDIKPDHNEIIEQDFLKLDTEQLEELKERYNNIHITGNPPYGRQSSIAIKFIQQSQLLSPISISFILAKSFKKESMKKHFDKYYHLIKEIDLPENSFLVDGNEYDVPCVFQIWKKEDYIREIPEKLEPLNFKFVKKNNNPIPDISFRRVGVNAGVISEDIENKSEQSHYFIIFTKESENKELIINNLKNIVFEHDNTAGPKSIGKQELIREFNKIF